MDRSLNNPVLIMRVILNFACHALTISPWVGARRGIDAYWLGEVGT